MSGVGTSPIPYLPIGAVACNQITPIAQIWITSRVLAQGGGGSDGDSDGGGLLVCPHHVVTYLGNLSLVLTHQLLLPYPTPDRSKQRAALVPKRHQGH